MEHVNSCELKSAEVGMCTVGTCMDQDQEVWTGRVRDQGHREGVAAIADGGAELTDHVLNQKKQDS